MLSTSANAAFCASTTGVTGSDGRPFSEFYTDGLPSLEECSDYVVLSAVEYAVINGKAEQLDSVEEITAENVAGAFAFGASTYAIFWFIGFKGRMARETIRAI